MICAKYTQYRLLNLGFTGRSSNSRYLCPHNGEDSTLSLGSICTYSILIISRYILHASRNGTLGYCWVNTPLDDAIWPALRSSCSVARRSARAKALNVASTMWWEFFPASCLHVSIAAQPNNEAVDDPPKDFHLGAEEFELGSTEV